MLKGLESGPGWPGDACQVEREHPASLFCRGFASPPAVGPVGQGSEKAHTRVSGPTPGCCTPAPSVCPARSAEPQVDPRLHQGCPVTAPTPPSSLWRSNAVGEQVCRQKREVLRLGPREVPGFHSVTVNRPLLLRAPTSRLSRALGRT